MQEKENFQENNNFETIISTWRRLSGEQVESSVLVSMSGDSPHPQPFKKKEEETNLLILERPKGPIATAASAGAAVATIEAVQETTEAKNPEGKEDNEEKQEFLKYNKEDDKEGAGDASFRDDKDDKSYLENDSVTSNTKEKNEKEKGDNVDSVYLRPPPTHKVRSNSSLNDEDDCGIKCLYYTLQCCDCVLM